MRKIMEANIQQTIIYDLSQEILYVIRILLFNESSKKNIIKVTQRSWDDYTQKNKIFYLCAVRCFYVFQVNFFIILIV